MHINLNLKLDYSFTRNFILPGREETTSGSRIKPEIVNVINLTRVRFLDNFRLNDDAVHRDRLRGENHNSTADNNYSLKNNNDNNRNHNDNNKVSKRAKPLDPEDDYYYYDDVDERNNPTNEAPVVPPGFLSPSVREYLDLGKSIPENKLIFARENNFESRKLRNLS
ncbi:hypothetical protein KQX54_006641 [Cotesia glomerata]|uniref:Uncharacterized protein n=1 Tax=Cotesia glomerata TaxID=32391 RepID=A0AAV7IYZ3_COTGL|nr:hypothetical protein KQX54_006641 [Cotesia glomerata]